MSSVDVLLTVGKLDASLALLTTQDHHVIEFPTVLLPENVKAGSIIKMQVSQNLEEERKQRNHFKSIQAKILEKYGSHKPENPLLKIVNVTQTSCVLAWEPLKLGSAKLKSLILYRKGIRSMVIPNPFKVTTTKISGLSVDTPYEFQLKLLTTSGTLWSEKIILRTHKMTDMSGITVCLGPLDPLKEISGSQVSQCLSHIGARPLQRHVAIDTTHFVCNDLDNEESDEELMKAKHNNIPIVRPEWVRACEVEKRIVGVRGFYLDADQSILKSYIFPPISEEEVANSKENETLPEEVEGVEQIESPNDDEDKSSQTEEQKEKSKSEAAQVSPEEDTSHPSAALENEITIETVNPSVRSLKSEPVGTPTIKGNEVESSTGDVSEAPNETVAQPSANEEAIEQKAEENEVGSSTGDVSEAPNETVAQPSANEEAIEQKAEENEVGSSTGDVSEAPNETVAQPSADEEALEQKAEDFNEHVNKPVISSLAGTQEGCENIQKDENNIDAKMVRENSETAEDAVIEPEGAEVEPETSNLNDLAEGLSEAIKKTASPNEQEEDTALETTPKAVAADPSLEPSSESEPIELEHIVSEPQYDVSDVSKRSNLDENIPNLKTEVSAPIEGSEFTEEQEKTEANEAIDDVLPTRELKKNNGNSNNNNKKKNKKNKKKGKKK